MPADIRPHRRLVLVSAGAAAASFPLGARAQTGAPAPHGATPSPRQLAWQRMEANAFVHFTVDTFTDREWGYGDEQPAVFNPTDFSADQIVGAVKAAGVKGVIITAKHHDGFCLWPTAYTEHGIKNSPFRGGKGDIVGEMAAAARRVGLKFGVYLSPWDRNRADYGTAAYVQVYRAQLTELLTWYGPISEVWFDGANGGDGYYAGARETRHIDADTYYDWPTTVALVRRLQPGAVTFGPDQASDIRWVGNEEGVAGDPCWATMDTGPYTQAKGNSGVRGGAIWWPAEVDVSIRPGWFWHADENGAVKSPAQLEKLYFQSVGRGANLLLNVPPDRRGRINEIDAASLAAWGAALAKMQSANFAAGARASATSERGAGFEAARVLDGDRDTYWACADGAAAPALILDLAGAQTFDVVRLREYLPLGLRVTRFALDVEADGGWREIANHLGIGAQRLVRLDAPVTTPRLRLRILDAPAGPAISEISLFRAPRLVDTPVISRDRAGLVSLTAGPGRVIRFTVDGPAPTATSPAYAAPFALPLGGTVRAIALDPANGAESPVREHVFDLATSSWRIVQASAPGAEALIDEDTQTVWTAPIGQGGQPCAVTIDFGRVLDLKGFSLTPPQVRPEDRPLGVGVAGAYRVEVGDDPAALTLAAQGEFSNIAASLSPQRILFAHAARGRYLRLTLSRPTGGEAHVAVAELGVVSVR
jgi:alpha-L-fucosidase